jgi:CYTH domain-containing protein
MKSLEIELTFLASRLPQEIMDAAPKRLVDIYIPENSSFPIVRLRQKGDEFEITKKVAVREGDFSSHIEHTISLTNDEFEAMRKSSNRTVEKDRYFVKIDNFRAEVDVFLGELLGLVMIDFEFENEDARVHFRTPTCCLADVTQEEFVLGGQLAGKSYADIQGKLDDFNYKQLIS